jgi:hypothetical protein
MRVYQVLVKDGARYRAWDRSAPSFEAPVVTINYDGLLEVREGGAAVVAKSDRYYLQLVYHQDANRFESGAVIAVFEQVSPPS